MKNVQFQCIDFPETLVVSSFNEGRIFIDLRTAPMALVMLHHLKTVFIHREIGQQNSSEKSISHSYGDVNPHAGTLCMNTSAFSSIVCHFAKPY